MTKILIIGKSGRVDVIATALSLSKRDKQLYAFSEVSNPGLIKHCGEENIKLGKTDLWDDADGVNGVRKFAEKIKPDFAIIGPEEPLATGIVDELEAIGIPCVGPTKVLAQIETSKAFTRELVSEYGIAGNPEYKIFKSGKTDGLEGYLRKMGSFVIKPDSLTGGKGVKVFGEHLHTIKESLDYCHEIFSTGHDSVIVEEKLDGEEFSLMSFCDGRNLIDNVVVQDHKRLDIDDSGPNTGGMGSYSCANHSLPFLKDEHLQQASEINRAVALALADKCKKEYKGILYGGFMLTRDGIKLIEYNARFGDPEVMNTLSLLKTDFIEVCEAMIHGTLDQVPVEFEKKASVCKYLVPSGYPTSNAYRKGINLSNLPENSDSLKIYFGAVNKKGNEFSLTGSRAIAFVGLGKSLAEAEKIAEEAIAIITKDNEGNVFHREDIGTQKLIEKRMKHISDIFCEPEAKLTAIC